MNLHSTKPNTITDTSTKHRLEMTQFTSMYTQTGIYTLNELDVFEIVTKEKLPSGQSRLKYMWFIDSMFSRLRHLEHSIDFL